MKILPSILLCGFVSSGSVWADNLNFSLVREDQSSRFQSVVMDPVTGKFYQRVGHGDVGDPDTVSLIEYANRSAFEAGTPTLTSPITLQDPGYYGTYVAASGGKLFGRTDISDTSAARFNLTTGAIETSVSSFPNMTGVNELGTFNWGGYTGVNFLQDSTGLYLLGKDTDPNGQTWQLSRVDADLNVLETKKFVADFTPGSEPDTLGFAAMIDGVLWMGDHHDAAGFDHTFDFTTGQYSAVDFEFVDAGATHYFDDVIYSPNDDALYVHNHDDFSFYKLDRAAPLLGRQAHTAPEGGGAYAAALLLLCAAHRFISLRPARS